MGAGVYVAAWIVGIYFVPGPFQKFIVQPSELAMETPYFTTCIDFTRIAFQLDAIGKDGVWGSRTGSREGDWTKFGDATDKLKTLLANPAVTVHDWRRDDDFISELRAAVGRSPTRCFRRHVRRHVRLQLYFHPSLHESRRSMRKFRA
jgi:hypothetical protein